jgi:hypothetical protein
MTSLSIDLKNKIEDLQTFNFPNQRHTERICSSIANKSLAEAIENLYERNVRPNVLISRALLSLDGAFELYSNLWDSLLPGQLDDVACRLAIHVARRIQSLDLLHKIGAHIRGNDVCQTPDNFQNLMSGLI